MITENELLESLPPETKIKIKAMLAFRPAELPEQPETGTWYVYRPAGCLCANGDPYFSTMRVGRENKLLVMFCGGGVALDAYSAARPWKIPPENGGISFYNPSSALLGYFYGRSGLANTSREDNPFRDWSMVVIQYTNGDFHCGLGELHYDDPEEGIGLCRHHGYRNYRAMLEKIREFVPDPEQVVVTGFSAGGFGTALLTDDIVEQFPGCRDFLCLVDSGLFVYDGWHRTAAEQWQAPKEISDRLVSDNLTVDSLLALHRKQGSRVKIAFDCTYRDALLSQAQNYADGNGLIFDEAGGNRFQAVLKTSVETLLQEVPDAAVYIFDNPSEEVKLGNLTDHTIVATDWAFEYSFRGVRFIDWVMSALEGKPAVVGTELL